jgi:hypothetical protein
MACTWQLLLKRVLWLECISSHKQLRWNYTILLLHWALYDSPNLFLHFYFNSHIVFDGEHTHRRSIHWHLVHQLICLAFLLPQVHRALYTCFSLTLPEMGGTFLASAINLQAIFSSAWFYFMILIFFFRRHGNTLLSSVIPGSVTDALDPANHHVIHNVVPANIKRSIQALLLSSTLYKLYYWFF